MTSLRFLSWDTNMADSKVARKQSHVSENTPHSQTSIKRPSFKPRPHEQIFCDNFSVINIFARVHVATNNTLKTNFHMRQK